MPTVRFVRENKEVQVEVGDSLRYVALENDIPIYCGLFKFGNCHGNGLCGTDRVEVNPPSAVTPHTGMERFALRQPIPGLPSYKKHPNLRLSCQIVILDDCEVITHCGRKKG
jgi:ferredoxin